MMVLVTVLIFAEAAVASVDAKVTSNTYDTEGHEHEKQHNYKECGRSMLASADSLPDHPKHAERLWNAARCFRKAHLVGQALKACLQLVSAHPKDPWVKEAIFQIAVGYHQLVYFSKAAEYYGEFARRFPSDKRAAHALDNATAFWIGLGQNEVCAPDRGSIECDFRRPREPAYVEFQMAEVYEKEREFDQLAKYLEGYLGRWANRAAPDLQIRVHFRLGELSWKASCKKTSDDGPCLEKRSSAAATAQAHFQSAVRLWDKGGVEKRIAGIQVESRAATATDEVAGALFYIAETQYEDYLRLDHPRRLRKLDGVKKTYQRVAEMHRAPWAMAAAARIGQMYKVSALLAAKAVEQFEMCLATATVNAWHGEWSRLCERELNRIRPSQFPISSEIKPEVMYDSPAPLSRVPLLSEAGAIEAQ